MSIGRSLRVDLSGVWPERKARAVVEAFQDEAHELGFSIERLDTTLFDDAYPTCLLQLHCLKHGVHVPMNSVCRVCMLETT